jgi:hypothetical protein
LLKNIDVILDVMLELSIQRNIVNYLCLLSGFVWR